MSDQKERDVSMVGLLKVNAKGRKGGRGAARVRADASTGKTDKHVKEGERHGADRESA